MYNAFFYNGLDLLVLYIMLFNKLSYIMLCVSSNLSHQTKYILRGKPSVSTRPWRNPEDPPREAQRRDAHRLGLALALVLSQIMPHCRKRSPLTRHQLTPATGQRRQRHRTRNFDMRHRLSPRGKRRESMTRSDRR